MLVILAGEEPLLQRGIGDDGDPQLLGRRQSAIRLDVPIEQAVLHLVRGQPKAMLRQRRVRTTHARHVEVADADRSDLIVRHQIRHGAHLILDRGEAQGIVHLVQIDCKGG